MEGDEERNRFRRGLFRRVEPARLHRAVERRLYHDFLASFRDGAREGGVVRIGGDVRVCVLHANVPAVLTNVASVFAKRGINIENMLNNSKGENAYTILDVNGDATDAVAALNAKDGIYRAYAI